MKQLTLATIYASQHPNSPTSNTSRCRLDNQNISLHPLDIDTLDDVFIDDAPVNFLLDIITKQCTFKKLNTHVWQLQYFMDGPYTQTLYVSFASCLASHPDALSYLPKQCDKRIGEFINDAQKLIKAVFIETSQYEPTNEVIHYASYLVRDTSSLAFNTLTRHSDRFMYVDGRGSVLLSPNEAHLDTFYMQVILLALAKAYLQATSAIISELGEFCEASSSMRTLYRQAVIFNAKSYFASPVKVNRYDAYTLWQDIRRTMPIDDINNEIVHQVQSIHRLLVEEEEAQERQNELKITNRLSWMGVGIGALSLVSLFEITPEKVTEFVGGWIGLFF